MLAIHTEVWIYRLLCAIQSSSFFNTHVPMVHFILLISHKFILIFQPLPPSFTTRHQLTGGGGGGGGGGAQKVKLRIHKKLCYGLCIKSFY